MKYEKYETKSVTYAVPLITDMYGELSRSDLISLTLSYDQKVKALTEEVCLLQKEMNQARYNSILMQYSNHLNTGLV